MPPIDTKTTQLLDAAGVAYRLLSHSEPVFTVETAAAQRDVVREEMVKSILLRETKTRRYVMACVLGHMRLDVQAVRDYLPGDWRRLTFARGQEITAVTGYVQGAVNPLALPDDVPVVCDTAVAHCPQVNISSGDPLAGLELKPADLLRLAHATLGDIAKGHHT